MNSNDTQKQSQDSQTQKESFYEFINNQKVVKSVSIINTKNIVENQPTILGTSEKVFTVYVIQIKTDYLDYQIQRRYSEFANLYQKISLKINIKLPPFPSKKMFGSIDEQTIQKRKNKLNNFLSAIFSGIIQDNLILEFIDIKSNILKNGNFQIDTFERGGYSNLIYKKESSADNLSQSEAFLAQVKSNPALEPKNEEEKMVIKFVRKLNKSKESKNSIFQKMESYFFGKMQFVSPNIFQYLLIGDQNKMVNGLLQNLYNGTAPQDHISCVMGFQFLRRILEFDYNPTAETSLKIFSELNMKQIKAMGLQNHIGGEIHKSCKQDALQVLHKYVNGNSMNDNFIQFMLEDDDSYYAYLAYRAKIQNSLQKYSVGQSEISDLQIEKNKFKSERKEGNLQLSELTIDQFNDFYKQNKTKWKLVREISFGKLWHINGKMIRIKGRFPVDLGKTYKLLTEHQKEWLKNLEEFRVLSREKNNNYVILERLRIRKNQNYQNLTYVSKVLVEKTQNVIKVFKESLEDLGSFSNELTFDDQLGNYKCIIEIKGINNEFLQTQQTSVKIMILISDDNSKLFFNPILLDENNYFQECAKKLEQIWKN